MKDVLTACPMAMSTLRLAWLLNLHYHPSCILFLLTLSDVIFLFSEICGAGSTGWRVHDVEAGGVSVWGGSRHLALPPHCSRLQWGWWESFCVMLTWDVCVKGFFYSGRLSFLFNIFHSSSGLYLASYESESPENQVEKDRWKALR